VLCVTRMGIAHWQSRCTMTPCNCRGFGAIAGSGFMSGCFKAKRFSGSSRVLPLSEHPLLPLTPGARLSAQVHEIAEASRRREVAFTYLAPASTMPFFCESAGGDDAEAVVLGALGIRPLHRRIKNAGAGYGAPGVVDDQALGNGPEPFECLAVATQPGGDGLVPDE